MNNDPIDEALRGAMWGVAIAATITLVILMVMLAG